MPLVFYMASQHATRFSAVTATRLLEYHGEDITHRIGGSTDDTETITAIVDLDTQRQTLPGNYVSRTDRHGQRSNGTVYLMMRPEVVVGSGDTFVLGDGRVVNYVDEPSSDTGNGLKKITCILPQGITTKRTRLHP